MSIWTGPCTLRRSLHQISSRTCTFTGLTHSRTYFDWDYPHLKSGLSPPPLLEPCPLDCLLLALISSENLLLGVQPNQSRRSSFAYTWHLPLSFLDLSRGHWIFTPLLIVRNLDTDFPSSAYLLHCIYPPLPHISSFPTISTT